MRRKRRREPTMAGSYSGSLPNPHWLKGRRIIYLDVPFAQKDAAKEAGARWNTDRRMWWIFADIDRAPFMAWLPDWEKPADQRRYRTEDHAMQRWEYEQITAQRRQRWAVVYPDRPYPGDKE
jgi:hypothetical protein